jgi:hypothetical protein
MALVGAQAHLEPPQVSPDIQQRAVERVREELSYEDAMILFPPPEEPVEVVHEATSLPRTLLEIATEDTQDEETLENARQALEAQFVVTHQGVFGVASLLAALDPDEEPVQSSTSEGAPIAEPGDRLTDEELRELHLGDIVRALRHLGINAGVREYTNNGIRTLYITFNGHSRLGEIPYNLSVSPTSEEGLVLAVQFE